jgi:hypothetical protein
MFLHVHQQLLSVHACACCPAFRLLGVCLVLLHAWACVQRPIALVLAFPDSLCLLSCSSLAHHLLQGNASDELPEQLLGCGRIYRSDFRRFPSISDTAPAAGSLSATPSRSGSVLPSPGGSSAAAAAAAAVGRAGAADAAVLVNGSAAASTGASAVAAASSGDEFADATSAQSASSSRQSASSPAPAAAGAQLQGR